MHHRILRRIVLISIACGLIVLWLLQGSQRGRRKSSEPTLSPHQTIRSTGQDIIERSLAIEAARNQLDQSVWAKELLAQKHEDVFIQLWDDLRNKPDKLGVLAGFAFDEITLGEPAERSVLEQGISRVRLTAPGQRLAPEAWRERVGQFKRDGYQLIQSEWRHPRFEAGTDGAVRSVIALTLHVIHPGQNQRWIIEGPLEVNWRENPDPGGLPFPTHIDATQLQILSQMGPPAFEEVLAKEIKLDLNPVFIDPLILYDLTGDGMSELILVGQNLLYRNLGNGRFQRTKLCQEFIPSVNTAVVADFDGDAAPDLLGADREGLILWAGDAAGRFGASPKRIRFTTAELPNPFVMTAGDIDRDGDLDIWLAQYKLPYIAGQMPTPYYDANDGFPSFLLLNDGQGSFRDGTAEAGLAKKRFRRTYSASFVDLDNEGDLDLLVVSDFAGVDLYYNDGRGHFTDGTETALAERHAFGMAHTFGDYNLDGQMDFLVIGMNSYTAERLDHLKLWPPSARSDAHSMRSRMAYGNRMYWAQNGIWEEQPQAQDVIRSGWSWGATSFDFDNDGDLDIYIVNGHKSRGSAKDYESQFWRHDIDVATSNHDPALDTYFRAVGNRLYGAGHSYGGYEKNRLFLNRNGESFLQMAFLGGVAMEEDCRDVVSDDLDGDGKLDLVVTTLEVWPEDRQTIHLFRNRLDSSGNWIGFHLREGGGGYSPQGAKVTLITGQSRQTRLIVTGDSYRSQHASTAHFGLGSSAETDSAEIQWPNGQIQRLWKPAINRYHDVRPPSASSP